MAFSEAPMHPDISISAPRDEQIIGAGLQAVTPVDATLQTSQAGTPAPTTCMEGRTGPSPDALRTGGGLLCGTWSVWMVGEKSPRALDFFPVSDVDPGRSGTGREWNMVTSRCRHERRRRLVFRPRRATVPPPPTWTDVPSRLHALGVGGWAKEEDDGGSTRRRPAHRHSHG